MRFIDLRRLYAYFGRLSAFGRFSWESTLAINAYLNFELRIVFCCGLESLKVVL
jgi:hypothetical protein